MHETRRALETSMKMQGQPLPTILPLGGLSHVRGDTSIPLSEQTVPALLAQTVAAFPEREAVVFREQGVRWSWREFAEAIDTLASGLHALGLVRGDRVGI